MIRLYAVVLRLLPRPLRERLGDDALDLFTWQLARQPGVRRRLTFVAGACADVIRMAMSARRTTRPTEPRKPLMEPFLRDVLGAARNLIRRPGQSLPIVLTLGLGIGLATAMVAVVRGVLLDPLPYPESDRLVQLREQTEDGAHVPASWLNFADWRDATTTLQSIVAVVGPRNATVMGAGEAVRLPVLYVGAGWFDVAGVRPHVGRVLRADENAPGGPPAVVVSHAFWTEHLASRADLENVSLTLTDLLNRPGSYAVVGVMPPGFELMGAADVYMPLERAVPWNVRGNHVIDVVGRLRAGASMEAVTAELSLVQSRLHATFAGETEAVGVVATSFRDEVVGPVRTPVVLLLAGALLLLATSFMNVSGALLARGIARQRELFVRMSLGATRGRLLAQLVVESGSYAVAGVAVGVVVAKTLLAALPRLAPASIPRLAAIDPAWLALAGAAGVLAGAGMLVFGLATAAITARNGAVTLRMRGAQSSRGTTLIWRSLIAAEVALALMLLTTAGVLGRSLWRIATADTGFDPAGVLTAEVDVPIGRYPDAAAFTAYFESVLDGLSALPGASSVGLSNMLPLSGGGSIAGPVTLEEGRQSDTPLHYRVADAGFFETLGIALLEGRTFAASDRPGAPHVAVVNRSMAAQVWPGEDPIGRRFHLGGMDPYRDDWLTVVGVVEEARPWSIESGARPTYYVHYLQRPMFLTLTGGDIVVRGTDAAGLAAGMRAALMRVDDQVPVRIRTLDERLASRTADRRFVLSLLGVFAVLALALTAAGIWSVVSFVASRRTRDMGIRLALGARPSQVLRGLQYETLLPVLVGMGAGVLLAGNLTRLVRAHLYGVDSFDPVSLAVVALTVAATAWLASWLPARRAKHVDPVVTLREP